MVINKGVDDDTIDKYEIEDERYGRNKATAVNHTSLKNGSYETKFKNISNDAEFNQLLAECAKEILLHRSGTEFEDMYWISVSEKKVVCKSTEAEKNPDYDSMEKRKGKVWYTDKAYEIIDKYSGDLITIHNHPRSFPPSAEDFTCNHKYNYVQGLTIGHNGNVFVYSSETEISNYRYNVAVADVEKAYSKDEITRRKEAINKMILKGLPIKCKEV